jgi:isopentenyl phosphate kinase
VAADVAQLRRSAIDVIVVTSGAITAGWAEVGKGAKRPHDASVLQAVSAVGQPLLMDAWRSAFATHDLSVGQVLLAPLDFSHRGQYLHARGTIEALETLGVVPIINENDAVADEEIRFGDNDRLAALVANLIGATDLVLLTDTPGLLTADPRLDPTASLIEEVHAIDGELEALAGASGSAVGSGGMASKVNFALDGTPVFPALKGRTDQYNGFINIAPSIEYVERGFDQAKYGWYSDKPFIDACLQSFLDPDMAPAGKHVMSCFVMYTPYELKGSTWDLERDNLGVPFLHRVQQRQWQRVVQRLG